MRILEKIGVENENIDGAVFNYYVSSAQNHIILGVLEQCEIIKLDSQHIQIRPGEFLMHGFRIHLDDPVNVTVTPTASSVSHTLVARLRLYSDRKIDFDFHVVDEEYELIQDDLFQQNEGTYEIVFVKMLTDSTGVNSFSNRLPVANVNSSIIDRIDFGSIKIISLAAGETYLIPRSSDATGIYMIVGGDLTFSYNGATARNPLLSIFALGQLPTGAYNLIGFSKNNASDLDVFQPRLLSDIVVQNNAMYSRNFVFVKLKNANAV